MKINADWLEIAAFFAIGAIIVVIHVAAVPFAFSSKVLALAAKAIYALALPFQRLLNRLSAPKNVSHQ